jgi:hypothetical protein
MKKNISILRYPHDKTETSSSNFSGIFHQKKKSSFWGVTHFFDISTWENRSSLAPQTTTRWRRRARSVLNPGLQWKKWSGNGKRYEKIIENHRKWHPENPNLPYMWCKFGEHLA